MDDEEKVKGADATIGVADTLVNQNSLTNQYSQLDIRSTLQQAVPNLQSADEFSGDCCSKSFTHEEMPFPELLHYAYCNILGFEALGPEEKVRWHIGAKIDDIFFVIAYTKFGLKLNIQKPCSKEHVDRIIVAQYKIAKITRKYLASQQESMAARGRFTLRNDYWRFFDQYEYFRKRAEESFSSQDEKPVPFKWNEKGEPIAWQGTIGYPLRKGGYYVDAMLNAFFSWLEHSIVLLYPFSKSYSCCLASIFIKKNWREQWLEIFENKNGSPEKRAFDLLLDVREKSRNPGSHGGFRRNGQSFFFHIDGISPQPLLAEGYDLSSDAFFTRTTPKMFKEICAQLDEAVGLLERTALSAGVKYIKTGLDVAYDSESAKEYKLAAFSAASMDEYIADQTRLYDLHMNMDY